MIKNLRGEKRLSKFILYEKTVLFWQNDLKYIFINKEKGIV